MRNILWSEWDEITVGLAVAAARMFPGVQISSAPYVVRLESNAAGAGGDVEARPSPDAGVTPQFRLRSSSCIAMSHLSALIAHTDALRRLAEAAAWVEAEVADLRVWYAAPCDHCGGRGRDGDRTCARCEGTGKRSERAPPTPVP